MATPAAVGWSQCEKEGCVGAQLAASRFCMAHAADEERHDALSAGVIDARGVAVTPVLLKQILTAAPHEDGRAVLKEPRFDYATFEGTAGFAGVVFDGVAGFRGAIFRESARFVQATFNGIAGFADANFSGVEFGGAKFHKPAEFRSARFQRKALFGKVTFEGRARFELAHFSRLAEFGGAEFSDVAGFDEVHFGSSAVFRGATFHQTARFLHATFDGGASFSGVTFKADAKFGGGDFKNHAAFNQAIFGCYAEFAGSTFCGDAIFTEASFGGDVTFGDVTVFNTAKFSNAKFDLSRRIGPLLVVGDLVLDGAHFLQPIEIEASSERMLCRQAQFPGGVRFRLPRGDVFFDDTDFPAPSILAGITHLASRPLAEQEKSMAQADEQKIRRAADGRPRLLSLRQANVAGLELSSVNADDCRFAGAHNLDQLRLEPNVSFATAPALVGQLNWDRRQVIAEERAWRADRSRRWESPQWPDWLQKPKLEPAEIATLYRALRKGREDRKDEPGAADFYYGEMEMRRHARRSTESISSRRINDTHWGAIERGVLTVYWLVSGYGLRAWRALACMVMVTAVFGLAFHLIGYSRPPQPISYWTSLLYASRADLSLSDDSVTLTAWGKVLQGLLRLSGPVLLGLALLALRGRVKR